MSQTSSDTRDRVLQELAAEPLGLTQEELASKVHTPSDEIGSVISQLDAKKLIRTVKGRHESYFLLNGAGMRAAERFA